MAVRRLESMRELCSLFDPEVHAAIRRLARGAHFLVVYENVDLCSSRLGDRTCVKVGPGCGFSTLEQALGSWLGDLPSERQYPVAYLEVVND